MRGSSLDSGVDQVVAPFADRPVRVAVGSTITVAGASLLAVLLAQSLSGAKSLETLIFGSVFPMTLACAVTVGGVLLLLSDYDGRGAVYVGLWWAIGSVVAGGTGVAIILFERGSGIALAEPAVILAGNAATGGLGGMVVGRSVARRHQAARERERERERLAEEREKLALLNRIVRHDIGNDLQVISGTADFLESHVDEAGVEPLERLQRTTAEAIELTDQVRTFVQALDDDEVERRPISIRRVLETQVGTARERHPEATIHVDGEIPDVAVLADELLATVVHNLVSNAVAHNDTADPTVEIGVSVGPKTVTLRVADDGPGIPEAMQETLFEQGELGAASGGTGIGLHIVDTLVDRYGGTVHVEDNDPRGAVFVVTLPRCQGESEEAEAEPQTAVPTDVWRAVGE